MPLAGIGVAGGAFHNDSLLTGGSGCNCAMVWPGERAHSAITPQSSARARKPSLHVNRLRRESN